MPLFTSAEWDFETIDKTWKAIDKIGKEVFELDYYPPSIEMITAEQMLDAYSSVAMPIMYEHWSFGKSFIENEKAYHEGRQGLAYEVVINTNPTIAYLMEENSMTMQTLVMAHAVCGHGSFFKNNYLFKEWTDADSIVDYLKFARDYIRECEEKHGKILVELTLDACHAIQNHGIDKYKRAPGLKSELKQKRKQKWDKYFEETFNPLINATVPGHDSKMKAKKLKVEIAERSKDYEGEENLLYFLEKHSPALEPWQKEIVRIVRKIAQYFYPQMQTQLMNEGWATFIHYEIMTHMHDEGLISDGSYLEFLKSHCAVVYQPKYSDDHYSGINVYALGYAMMRDIKRICQNPTKEDKEWFPDIAGSDWLPTMKHIIEEYRDESFVQQFLSPKVMRDFKLFSLNNNGENSNYLISTVQNDVLAIRQALAKNYSITYKIPQIEVEAVKGPKLTLKLIPVEGTTIHEDAGDNTASYVGFLWGGPVVVYHEEN